MAKVAIRVNLHRKQRPGFLPRSILPAQQHRAREGDSFVVTKLDRLAHSVSDLVAIADALRAKGVALRILAPDIDTSTPMGQLMLNLLTAIAQFERQIMLERQREGIAKDNCEGRYVGRRKTAQRHATKVKELAAEGTKPAAIAKALGSAGRVFIAQSRAKRLPRPSIPLTTEGVHPMPANYDDAVDPAGPSERLDSYALIDLLYLPAKRKRRRTVLVAV